MFCWIFCLNRNFENKKIFKQKIVYVVLNMCHNYDKFFSKHLFMLALTVFVIADDRFIR